MSVIDWMGDVRGATVGVGRMGASWATAPERVALLWARQPLRQRVLAAFLLINLAAAAVTAAVVIYNAKRATEVEVAASMAVAERFVRASIDDLGRNIPGGLMLEDVVGHVGPLRHVKLVITTVAGRPIWQERPRTGDEAHKGDRAPAWFISLLRIEPPSREVPVSSGGRKVGTVLILGDPEDEIAEVWGDMSSLAVLAGAVNLAVILLLHFAFGRLLTPLTALSEGLRHLEQGHFTHRLAVPGSPELADLSRRFNALAVSLALAREENLRLHRCLLTAQEDERRLIAKELHDEMGPCVFGLRANMASLDRLAAKAACEEAPRLRQRVGVLSGIADRIAGANRRVLERLRPVALGEVALADLLAGLVQEFAEHDGAPAINFAPARLDWSYGDCADLTVYRCLQEGLTNVIRHAGARRIDLRLEELQPAAAAPAKALRLVVRDDGNGIPPGTPFGIGLTGMKERVQALGGRFSIAGGPGGTRLEVVIPGQPLGLSAHDIREAC